MNKARSVAFVSIVGIFVIGMVTLPVAKAGSCCPDHGQKPKMDMKKHMEANVLSLEQIHSAHLPMASKSIDKAIKAIEAGNKEIALAELNKAQKMLAKINEGIAKHVKPKFTNIDCPIMGAPINTDKVAKNLIRDYKGEKIAFCCAGCPATWDKLADAEKDAKLAKVKPKPMENHTGCKH
jgi:hypothetical protein